MSGFLTIKTDREVDGRWIAETPESPGALVYGQSRKDAVAKVTALALRIMADRLEHGEDVPAVHRLFSVPS